MNYKHITYFPEKGTPDVQLLMERVIENSAADTWDKARKEWKHVFTGKSHFGVQEDDGGIQCICRKHISNVFYLDNDITKTSIWVGSDCIERFFAEAMRCETCDRKLKNITQRLLTGDKICRPCKTKKKREDIQRYSEYTWRMPDGWHLKTFKVLQKDEKFLNYYANIDSKNPTVLAFLKYLDLKGFEIR